MKTLYLVRHAKSSWDQSGIEDHERPIIEKGKKRTKVIIDYLLSQDITVDLMISSFAVRALDTARIIARALNYQESEIQISKSIYHGDADSLLDLFYDISDKVNSLMLFGHNPTITNFANFFLDKKIDSLPTSGVVCLEFDTDKWEEISTAKKRTKFVISPKSVKEGNRNKRKKQGN